MQPIKYKTKHHVPPPTVVLCSACSSGIPRGDDFYSLASERSEKILFHSRASDGYMRFTTDYSRSLALAP